MPTKPSTFSTTPEENDALVELVDLILDDSARRGASDIHVEPYEREVRIRFRIDGILYVVMSAPMKLRDALTARIKKMARVDVTEMRLPQYGRIRRSAKNDGPLRVLEY